MACKRTDKSYQDWSVLQTVELGASADKVWEVIGGFFTMHEWHPDIAKSEVQPNQISTRQIRRVLTFPGQPTTTEELVDMSNSDHWYTYKWYAGQWGEDVQQYKAKLRVFDTDMRTSSVVQWSSTFYYYEDALSPFYKNGFNELLKKFGAPNN